jgi:hypothetical protein
MLTHHCSSTLLAKAELDRYYVKTKTVVLPDAADDAAEFERAMPSPIGSII